jgi:hypothetical protein
MRDRFFSFANDRGAQRSALQILDIRAFLDKRKNIKNEPF